MLLINNYYNHKSNDDMIGLFYEEIIEVAFWKRLFISSRYTQYRACISYKELSLAIMTQVEFLVLVQ